LELSIIDALFAHNKIRTQQIKVLTKKMSKFPHQIHAINSPQTQNQPRTCEVCGEIHSPSQCSYDPTIIEEVQYMNNERRQGWRSNPSQNFGWKQDNVSSNRKQPYQQQQQQYPSFNEKISKLEDMVKKFMKASFINQRNTGTSIMKLET